MQTNPKIEKVTKQSTDMYPNISRESAKQTRRCAKAAAFLRKSIAVSMLAFVLLAVTLFAGLPCATSGDLRASGIAGNSYLPAGLLTAYASESGEGETFTTQYFNTDIKVNSDNSVNVTEVIAVTFSEPRHGLYRYIPIEGTAYSEYNGETVSQDIHMKIDQINVVSNLAGVADFEYNTETDSNGSDNVVIQIGDDASYVEGEQVYIISYRARIYDDGLEEYDSFYWNALPHSWPTAIEQGSVRITMPAQFPLQDEAEFLAGTYGSTDTTSMKFAETSKADGTVEFCGEFENFAEGEGITFQAVLPEGYFSGELNNNWALFAMIAAMAAALLLSFVLWLLLGRDPKVVQTVEFSPPEGIGPEELGYIVDGEVDKADLVSLFVYFAYKGYLSIREIKPEKSGGFLEKLGFGGAKKSDFEFEKLCEIPGTAPLYERTFFDGIFKAGAKVLLSELSGDFGLAYAKAMEELERSFRDDKTRRIFTKSSLLAQAICSLIMMVPMWALALFGFIWKNSVPMLAILLTSLLLLPGGLMSMHAFAKKYSLSKAEYRKKRVTGGALIGLALVISGVAGALILASAVGKAASVLAVAAVICSLVSYKFAMLMTKRTKYGARMLGKILGFREFLRLAEREKIEKLAAADPAYFYAVLPYAYVLGLSDKWIKSFENIDVTPPSWYSTGRDDILFNICMLSSMMNACRTAAGNAVEASHNISNGEGVSSGGNGDSFSGGGGFSGGGFGGGSGGSC